MQAMTPGEAAFILSRQAKAIDRILTHTVSMPARVRTQLKDQSKRAEQLAGQLKAEDRRHRYADQ